MFHELKQTKISNERHKKTIALCFVTAPYRLERMKIEDLDIIAKNYNGDKYIFCLNDER